MSETLRHKTAVIIGTVTPVPGYPKKLKVYLNNASPYWQAVYWDKGITYRRTTKTIDKLAAYQSAIAFYEVLILKKYLNLAHLKNHIISQSNQPVKIRKPNSTHLQFKKVAMDWLERQALKWSPRHKEVVENRLTNNMFRYVANKNIQLITKLELLGLLQKMEARGACDLVRRLLSDCRQIWQYAILLDYCKVDITVGLGAALHGHIVVHQKAVDINELPELLKSIAAYDVSGDRIYCYALQLIALTFVRKSEMTHAKWEEFDLENALWKIPAERMKKRIALVVPLSKQALGLLHYIKQTYPSDCYVINNGNPNVTIPEHALMQALYRMGYKNRMTVHGFRAIASTVLNEHKFRSEAIESQLAHIEQNAVRRAYNRAQYMDERIKMMAWWGDYLENITPFNTP